MPLAREQLRSQISSTQRSGFSTRPSVMMHGRGYVSTALTSTTDRPHARSALKIWIRHHANSQQCQRSATVRRRLTLRRHRVKARPRRKQHQRSVLIDRHTAYRQGAAACTYRRSHLRSALINRRQLRRNQAPAHHHCHPVPPQSASEAHQSPASRHLRRLLPLYRHSPWLSLLQMECRRAPRRQPVRTPYLPAQ